MSYGCEPTKGVAAVFELYILLTNKNIAPYDS